MNCSTTDDDDDEGSCTAVEPKMTMGSQHKTSLQHYDATFFTSIVEFYQIMINFSPDTFLKKSANTVSMKCNLLVELHCTASEFQLTLI